VVCSRLTSAASLWANAGSADSAAAIFVPLVESTRSLPLNPHDECDRRLRVSVILTVKNDSQGCAQTLESLTRQSRRPDEVVVVDGGSTDQTKQTIQSFSSRLSGLTLIERPGANIAQGRDIATRHAAGPVIASIDAGCTASPNWLAKLVDPFHRAPHADVVAGMYDVEAATLFEKVVGLTTMRGQLAPVNPATFNPSGRSMAYTKDAWSRAGGWPTWLCYSEDTLFDHRLRRVATGWHFASDAIVFWRPRSSFRKLARQFYCYGTGRGQTQIGAADFLYNLRNVLLLCLAVSCSLLTPWVAPIAAGLFGYFFIWSFHHKAVQVVRRTGKIPAYVLMLLIMWVVMISNLAGYLRGTWQRLRDPGRFRNQMEAYLVA
jgi:glycosyltransferase involved in cell wall biosynthesis